MNLISFEDFQKLEEYQKFSEENSSTGTLKVEAFTAYGAVPIPDVEILVTKDFGNYRVIFFRGYTDSSGMISDIVLPAPAGTFNPTTFETPNYTLYDLAAISEGYESIKRYNIGIFGDVSTIQYVRMIPKVELEGVDTNGN